MDVYNFVRVLLNRGIPVDLDLLDFAQAFDKECHPQLLAELIAIGVSQKKKHQPCKKNQSAILITS
jgi:hypothetical protein